MPRQATSQSSRSLLVTLSSSPFSAASAELRAARAKIRGVFSCLVPNGSKTVSTDEGGFGANGKIDTPRMIETHLLPKHRRRLLQLADQARRVVTSRFDQSTKQSSFRFWRILVTTAVLSSLVSYIIDQTTLTVGNVRTKFTNFQNGQALLGVIAFDVGLVILARLIVRTSVEAEGSGFPEMKAMIFGKAMEPYLTLKVLFVKATALSLGIGAGLPLGKEGPNVHMAGCISRSLGPDFYHTRRAQNTVAGIHLLLAACAVGVGCSFSAPIGGVIFSLELVLPQVFDYIGYFGCCMSAVTGSICFALYRSWTLGSETLVPLMSTNIASNEGLDSPNPSLRLALDIVLGAVCGLLAGIWIKLHAATVKAMKLWRQKEDSRAQYQMSKQPEYSRTRTTLYHALLGGHKNEPELSARQVQVMSKVSKAFGATREMTRSWWTWRDLIQITAVVILNTVLADSLPLLNGRPQPLLLSKLFDKNLLSQSDWVVTGLTPCMTMICCFLMKFVVTILALCLPNPAGVVAPAMIIGGLLGRVFGMCLPEAIIKLVLEIPPGNENTPEVWNEALGAFMARLAIVGAAAFCAGVCRAFAMAITVFEVLAMPESVLPLCSASLAAITVANRIALPYFDTNLMGRGLGGISALTQTKKATEPAFTIMKRLGMEDCLQESMTVAEVRKLIDETDDDVYAIAQSLSAHWHDCQGILKGSIRRNNVEKLLADHARGGPEAVIDFRNAQLQRPTEVINGPPLPPMVEGTPLCVVPLTTLQEVYLLMKITRSTMVYVCEHNLLFGEIKWKELLGHSLN